MEGTHLEEAGGVAVGAVLHAAIGLQALEVGAHVHGGVGDLLAGGECHVARKGRQPLLGHVLAILGGLRSGQYQPTAQTTY